MKHQKGGSNLVPKPIAFLFYLGLLIDTQPEDPQILSKPEPQETFEADAPISFYSVFTIENLDKAKELKDEPIDLAIEEKESANLDVAMFRATTTFDEPIEDIPISLNSLSSFSPYQWKKLHYTSLNFDPIVEASQVAKDFVDIEGESKEEFLSLDLETSNQKFWEALDAFCLCLKRVVEEEPTLKDEDFKARLVELGIDKFGRNIVEPDKISSDMGAKINLEHEGQIEADELQKIELLDEDKVLGRDGGSRATSKYTSHALIHYLPNLEKGNDLKGSSSSMHNSLLSHFKSCHNAQSKINLANEPFVQQLLHDTVDIRNINTSSSSVVVRPHIRSLLHELLQEYKDVFPKDLSVGLFLERTIDHGIETMPGTKPISKPPYRLSHIEAIEVEKQLANYCNRGYIKPSASPWAYPILLVKK
ncbi:hypothetical protein L7F22_002246 [Adiantum nelumboides]|nr:hypothetical protein [Adiantum nelumboides]